MKVWLKIVCIALLLYAAFASLYHPLIPGGLDVTTSALRPGTNEFEFVGYNTHFNDPALQPQFFVASGKNYYCAQVIANKNAAHALVRVELPDTLPSKSISFYANNLSDGTVYVKKSIDTDSFVISEALAQPGCEVKVNTDEHSGFGYPFQIILFETIRNLMWHVPMWFTMFLLMIIAFVQSLRFLSKAGRSSSGEAIDRQYLLLADTKAAMSASAGLVFCTLGLITGSVWARFAWGAWWTNDPQLNGAMVVFIVYIAYFILRSSIADEEKRARLSAIFNIFAFVLMVILLMVMPRFSEGLHPGKSGNPAFSSYDLDSSLRTVFYPAVFGWALLGYWIYTLLLRTRKLEILHEEN